MSILTLSIDQTLMIADHVTVTILEIDGSQICIGMNAPEEMSVDPAPQSHQKIQETVAIAGQSNRRWFLLKHQRYNSVKTVLVLYILGN